MCTLLLESPIIPEYTGIKKLKKEEEYTIDVYGNKIKVAVGNVC